MILYIFNLIKKKDYSYMPFIDQAERPVFFKEVAPAVNDDVAAQAAPGGMQPSSVASETASDTNQNKMNTLVEVKKVRSDFSETWIWDKVLLNESGETDIHSIIPDTITSWIASGFALSNKTGLGVANKTQITGFQGFFVSMILPASLIRGETLVLQVVVQNYLDVDLENVVVTLVNTTEFKRVIVKSSHELLEDIKEDIKVKIPLLRAQNGKSVTFIITPVKLGMATLTVKAQSSVSADAERKKILVKAEGVEKSYTMPYLIDMRGKQENSIVSNEFNISFPSELVQDSQFCSVQLIGDILGSAFNNLNNLITKPYGCGEQNMLTVTPNIYAVKYMLANSAKKKNIKNQNEILNTAKNNIQYGYQNQLKYVHKDGSFSAFGESDRAGSSWLTAFVVKSFSQARKFANIDNDVLNKSVKWLISQQQEKDGSFIEPGNVIHKEMQGGVNSNLTITAYITISMLESNLNGTEIDASINKALKYLIKSVDSLNDTYALGLVTYALNLATKLYASDAQLKDAASKSFEKFNTFANTSVVGQIYWAQKRDQSEENRKMFFFYDYQTPSSDVEMSSYGLLTYLLRNKLAESMSIVRWLVSKSNSLGAYSSTQNTILALQSLSQFSLDVILNENSKLDLNVQLETVEKNVQMKSFNVTEENSLVLQSWDLPTCPTKLKLSASGSGLVSFQTIVIYNEPKAKEEPLFKLTQQVLNKITINNLLLETCVVYLNRDPISKKYKETGMSIIESTLLGGFEADKLELESIAKSQNKTQLKLVELKPDQNKVVFYFNKLDENSICFEWKITRKYPVANLQPVPVTVYDYYRPEINAVILFSPPDNIASICQLTDCKNENKFNKTHKNHK